MVAAQLMNAHQQHHVDMRSALVLTEREWELWCQQWHMYKRDCAIGITHGMMPKNDARYEVVCLYIEALTKMENTGATCQEGWQRVCFLQSTQVLILLTIVQIL